MEERPLLAQLFDPAAPGTAFGERRGFGSVPWDLWDLTLVSSVGLLSLAALSQSGFPPRPGGVPAAQLAPFLEALAAYGVVLGAIWLVTLRHGPSSAAELSGRIGFRPLDLPSLARFLGLFAVLVLAANLLLRITLHVSVSEQVLLFGRTRGSLLLMALLVVVVAPIVEEVFFRSFVLQTLAGRVRFWPAAVLSSACFAVSHLSVASAGPLFLAGLLFAWLFWRTGSLWASVAAHATLNGASLVMAVLLL